MSSSEEKIFLNRAMEAARKGNKREAAVFFKKVVKVNPANVQAWLGLAWALDKEQEKRFCLKRVLEIEPNNRYAIRMLQDLKAKKRVSSVSTRVSEGHAGSAHISENLSQGGMVTKDPNNHDKMEAFQKRRGCFYHPRRPAVSQCPKCGKLLCKSCAEGLGGLCIDCGAEVVDKEMGRLRKEVFKTFMPIVILALLGGLYGFASEKDVFSVVMTMYMFAGVPVGWKGIKVMKLKWKKATSVEDIFVQYAGKFFFAMLLGLFLQPFVVIYWIVKFWKRYKTLARQQRRVQQMRASMPKQFVNA